MLISSDLFDYLNKTNQHLQNKRKKATSTKKKFPGQTYQTSFRNTEIDEQTKKPNKNTSKNHQHQKVYKATGQKKKGKLSKIKGVKYFDKNVETIKKADK